MSRKEVMDALGCLDAALIEFLAGKPQPETADFDPMALYTESPDYLGRTITAFHKQHDVIEFKEWLLNQIQSGQTVWDVGCSCGWTGLTLALNGHDVAFHDYEGLALDFIRWFADREGLDVQVFPYDSAQLAPLRDWAIALDVIEHTGNHLSFLWWMKTLGHTVAFSVPHVPWLAPYLPVLDEWVDIEAIRWVVERRYRVLSHHSLDGRNYMVYR